MKKGIAVLLALLCMVAFAGCSGDPETQFATVNEMEGVTLELKEDTLKATSGTFLLTNGTDAEISYRDAYHMEKKDADGHWKEFVGTANATWGRRNRCGTCRRNGRTAYQLEKSLRAALAPENSV